MWPFRRKRATQDWVQYLGGCPPATRKQRLLDECKRLDVSIHVDDSTEASSGIYGELRGVASEAELERRLNAKNTVLHASRANKLAIVALVVSLISLIASLLAHIK